MRTTFPAALASLLALRASAAGLTLEMTQVDGSIVKTNLTNTGPTTIKMLKDPRTVLSSDETETFTLTGTNGSPKFKGIRMKYSPALALKNNDPASFVVLGPGESHVVEHDLSRAFDLGQAQYKIEALREFTQVDSSGQLSILNADVVGSTIFESTGITHGSRNFRPRGSTSRVRQVAGPEFIGCSPSQTADIRQAIPAAETYITDSLANLNANPSGDRYTTWFGEADSDRLSTVKSHFEQIQGQSWVTAYDCSTCDKPNVYAYVYPNQPGKVYLCPVFWRAPLQGSDSKAGTLIHEQSHFDAYGGTRDYAYGQTSCRELAKSEPITAIMNADNHEYFAENTPFQS